MGINHSARADWIATGWGTGYGRSRSDVHVLNLVLDSNFILLSLQMCLLYRLPTYGTITVLVTVCSAQRCWLSTLTVIIY
eukprot:SAG31_NODE_34741_length_329_cov_15.195652_1_plen_79_part_01